MEYIIIPPSTCLVFTGDTVSSNVAYANTSTWQPSASSASIRFSRIDQYTTGCTKERSWPERHTATRHPGTEGWSLPPRGSSLLLIEGNFRLSIMLPPIALLIVSVVAPGQNFPLAANVNRKLPLTKLAVLFFMLPQSPPFIASPWPLEIRNGLLAISSFLV